MDLFDDDNFEDILNQFMGNSARVRKKSRSKIREDEEQNTQFIEEDKYIYCIIELPGYQEEEVNLSIKEDILIISARAINNSNTQDYFSQKHKEGITLQQRIPSDIKTKNLKKTFRNGVLEVTFEKR